MTSEKQVNNNLSSSVLVSKDTVKSYSVQHWGERVKNCAWFRVHTAAGLTCSSHGCNSKGGTVRSPHPPPRCIHSCLSTACSPLSPGKTITNPFYFIETAELHWKLLFIISLIYLLSFLGPFWDAIIIHYVIDGKSSRVTVKSWVSFTRKCWTSKEHLLSSAKLQSDMQHSFLLIRDKECFLVETDGLSTLVTKNLSNRLVGTLHQEAADGFNAHV